MKSILAVISKSTACSLAVIAFFTIVHSAMFIDVAKAAETATLRDDDGRMALKFGKSASGFPLEMVYDALEKRVLTKPGTPLWTVELQHASGKTLTVTSTGCGPAEADIQNPSFTTLTWSLDEALEKAGATGRDVPSQQFRAVCSVQINGSRALMKLRLYNETTTWSIRNVTFPSIELVQLGKADDDDALVYPFASGRIVKSPLRKDFFFGDEKNIDRPGRYSASWANMQFCAYWDNDGGLYIAAEDPMASRKIISVRPADDHASISIKILWPAENIGIMGNDFEHPGSIVLELFDGDWYDAAKLYRRWVKRDAHWWPPTGAEGRIDTPDWMKDTAVWARASLKGDTIDQTIQFAEFMGVPTALQLYNWHQVPFDNDYPHYFPPKDGFSTGVRKLQEAGVRVVPYINARLWDDDTEDFRSFALPAATKKENGDYYIEIYGSGEKLVPMCPTTDLWKNTVRTTVMNLVGPAFDVDGVYLDQVTAMSPVLCFDPSHGHPLGGGHWWMEDGYWPMLEGIQKTLAEEYPDKILTSESNAEPYMHAFDGYLTWHYQFNDMVPLFSAVYGGAIQQFGRAYSGNDFLAYRMRIGQSLVFGEQVGWIRPNILEKDMATAEYLRDTAQVRHSLLRYLSWGEMMHPPEVQGDIPRVTSEWGWADEEKTVTDSAVQKGAWKSPDGKVAFIFTNVSGDYTAFTWRYDPSRYGFGKENVIVEPLRGATDSFRTKKTKNIPITLSSNDIVVYIASPVGN